MKKAISLSFLLLAGVVMLAHVIVLHHHHDESAVCFLTAHCLDGEEAYKHSHDFGRCQCNNCSTIEECKLDIYIRPVKHKLMTGLNLNTYIQHPAEFLFLNNLTAEIAGLDVLLFRLELRPSSCHTNCISDSSGLRAPPAFV
jgi:hypothetical protein